jgi:hypothetical protein
MYERRCSKLLKYNFLIYRMLFHVLLVVRCSQKRFVAVHTRIFLILLLAEFLVVLKSFVALIEHAIFQTRATNFT